MALPADVAAPQRGSARVPAPWRGPGFRRPGAAMWGISAGAVVLVGAGAAAGPLAAVVALGTTALGTAIVFRPVLGGLVLVALVPAVSGLVRGLPVPGLRPSELLIGAIALVVLVTADRRAAPRWGALDWLLLAYVAGTALLEGIALAARGEPFTVDHVGEMAGPLQFLLLYRAIAVALESPADCRRALALLLLASVPVSVLTAMQQFDVAGARGFLAAITGGELLRPGRMAGPFPQWHELGGYMFPIVFLGVALWLAPGQRVMRRGPLAIVVALSITAVLQTATLAPIIAAAAGTAYLVISYGQVRRVAVGLAVLVVLGALVSAPLLAARVEQQFVAGPGRPDRGVVPSTLAYRVDVWREQYVPALAEHLAGGFGPGVPPEVTWQFTESTYVTVLLRGGVPLLLVFLALSVALVRAARAARDRDDVERDALARVLVFTAAALIPLQFVAPYFVLAGPPHVLWALVGVLAAWGKAAARP